MYRPDAYYGYPSPQYYGYQQQQPPHHHHLHDKYAADQMARLQMYGMPQQPVMSNHYSSTSRRRRPGGYDQRATQAAEGLVEHKQQLAMERARAVDYLRYLFQQRARETDFISLAGINDKIQQVQDDVERLENEEENIHNRLMEMGSARRSSSMLSRSNSSVHSHRWGW